MDEANFDQRQEVTFGPNGMFKHYLKPLVVIVAMSMDVVVVLIMMVIMLIMLRKTTSLLVVGNMLS